MLHWKALFVFKLLDAFVHIFSFGFYNFSEIDNIDTHVVSKEAPIKHVPGTKQKLSSFQS